MCIDRWRISLQNLFLDRSTARGAGPGGHFSVCPGLYLERVPVSTVPVECKSPNIAVDDRGSECNPRTTMVEYVCVDPDHDRPRDCDCDHPGTLYYARFTDWSSQRLIQWTQCLSSFDLRLSTSYHPRLIKGLPLSVVAGS